MPLFVRRFLFDAIVDAEDEDDAEDVDVDLRDVPFQDVIIRRVECIDDVPVGWYMSDAPWSHGPFKMLRDYHLPKSRGGDE